MWRFIIPIGLFATLAVFLFVGLGRDKQTLPSPLIGKPAPLFELPRVDDPCAEDLQPRVRRPSVRGEYLGQLVRGVP